MSDLPQLLKWAKRNELYIQIYESGKVNIVRHATEDDPNCCVISAPTLLSALRKAKKYIEKGATK
jgi:hypothetical protein